jgi:hypothetical protein
MSFSVTPTAGFPPEIPDTFPAGLQWQLEGANVGDRTIDTVNFIAGATLAMEVDNVDPAKLNITIPSGGGGTVPNLIVSLEGADFGAFDNIDFTDWTATVVQTSTDAEWSVPDGGVKFSTAGLYRVTMVTKVRSDTGNWPNDSEDGSTVTKYGSAVTDAVGSLTRSVHERSAAAGGAQESSPGNCQWTDEYIVNAEVDDVTVPAAYAAHYNGEGLAAGFAATLVVTKL